MTVDRQGLFERAKALWPNAIDISSDPDATNKIYWANEAAHPSDDEWLQLAMWSFHQALRELESGALKAGVQTIAPQEIAFASFDARMRSNLNGDNCWLSERAAWDALG